MPESPPLPPDNSRVIELVRERLSRQRVYVEDYCVRKIDDTHEEVVIRLADLRRSDVVEFQPLSGPLDWRNYIR